MDILQRAARFLDRAQGQVSNATSQAARMVYTAAQIRSLETRQQELRQQMEAVTLELGKLSFGRWKSGDSSCDPTMSALCLQIDAMNAEYQQVLGDLTEARAAAAPASTYAPALPAATGMSGFPELPEAAPLPYPSAPYRDPALSATSDPYVIASSTPSRPPQPARECPECYALVPGGRDFCPSCGMRV